MPQDWTDRLAGARMQVDQQFQRRVEGSQFTNQEWGLIMTAVEFDIEEPGNPDRARLVARTEKVADVIPELERIQSQMGPGGGGRDASGGSSGGILGQINDLLGFGGDGSDGDDDRLRAATALADDYAVELQTFLEEQDRWEELRRAADE